MSVVRLTRRAKFTRVLSQTNMLGLAKLATLADVVGLVGLIVPGQFHQLPVAQLLNFRRAGLSHSEYWHLY